MNEELLKYYNYLKSSKADVPDTYESFNSTLQDESNAKRYFSYLKANNFDTPDTFDSFANTFGLTGTSPSEVTTPQEVVDNDSSDFSDVIDHVSPLGKPLYKLGEGVAKAIHSGVADVIPQTAAQTNEVLLSTLKPSNIDEYIRKNKQIDFQRYVREKDPKYSGVGGFFTGFDIEESLPKYGKAFMEDKGLGGKITEMEQALPKVIERRKELETYVSQQKSEAQEKFKGVIQDYRDINSVADLGSYIGSLAGQAAYQIPLSVATRGGSSFLMEAATVYDKQLDKLAEENGISREEVIEKNLDSPVLGQTYAILAAGLDAGSAGNLVGAFRKNGGSLLKKYIMNVVPESVTEATQGVLEDVGAGGTVEEALTGEGLAARLNELAGGFVGGSVFSFAGKSEQKKVADQMLNETDAGAPLNSIIDAEATLTPQEEEQLKTKIAETRLEEANESEQKLVKEEEKITNDVIKESDQVQEEVSKPKEETKESVNPEYQAAVDKVTELQRKFSELDINANTEELYGELISARDALRRIAPSITAKSAGKTDIQKTIEDNTGVTKQEPIVVNNPAKALKEQIQAHYKAVEEGVKKGQKLTNETLIPKVQEAINNFSLSDGQVNSILNRVKKTNLFTPGSINKLNTFIDRVTSDADYAEQVNTATQLKNQIKSKAKNRSFKERNVLKQFNRINPSDVSDINEYNQLASSLAESLKTGTFNIEETENSLKNIAGKIYQQEIQTSPDQRLTSEDMLDSIDTKLQTDKENIRIQNLADEMNTTFDQARAIYDSEEETDDKTRKEIVRQKYLAEARGKEIEDGDFDELQKQDVDNIKAIDPSLLKTTQLKEYIKIIDRINENGDFADSGKIAAIGAAQKGWAELKKLDTNILNLNALEQILDSQPMAIEAIFGLPKDAALFQLYAGIKGINEAAAVSVREAENFADVLEQLRKELKSKGFDDGSLHRQGIYQELIRKPQGMNPVEAFAINMDLVKNSIAKKAENGYEKEAAIDEQYFKPFKEAKSIEEVSEIMQRVDPEGKRVIDTMIEWHGSHKFDDTKMTFLELIKSDNERFEGKDIEEVDNYASPRVWKKIGRGQKVDFDDITEYSNNLRAPRPKQIRSGKSLTMRDREGAVLDFNIHKNAIDNIQTSVLRAYAKPYQFQVREFINNNQDLVKLFGGKDAKSLQKANDIIDAVFNENSGIFFNFEKDLMKNGRPYKSKFVKGVSSILNGLKKTGYAITLSGYTQAPKQATVLANVAVQLGKKAGYIASSQSELSGDREAANAFFRGETVDTRGEQIAILNVGRFYNASSRLEAQNKLNNLLSEYIPQLTDKRFRSKWGGAGVLTTTDVGVSKTSFLSFYKQYLNDNGVEYQGLEVENQLRNEKIRKEARAFAKQRVDTLQVVSNPAEQAVFMKEQGLLPELARAWFVPYGGFAASSKARLYNDWSALVMGNSKQRKAALRDITGTFIEQGSFVVVSQALKLGLVVSIGALLREAFDLDDEDDWEKWWSNTKKTVGKDMIFSNLPVLLGNPGEDGLVDFINHTYFNFLKQGEPSLTEKEYEKNHAPLARYKNYDDNWWDYLGPYGAPIAKLAEGFETQNEYKNDKLSSDQKRLALMAAISQYAQLVGLLPADIANPVKTEFRKQKSSASNEKRNPRYRERIRN